MKKAILAVSFGTTYEYALMNSIEALEKDIKKKFREYDVFRAFTSSIVIKKLEKKNMHIDSVQEALDRLLAESYDEVIVQPTHIINGIEYDKICQICSSYKSKFDVLKTGVPLFDSYSDMTEICTFFSEIFPKEKALAFMGHGTEHAANGLYEHFGEVCRNNMLYNMFVGTVEGTPDVDDVISGIKKSGYSEAVITPLMFVAGDHALNDMAGDDSESWKNRFEAAGISVEPIIKGLGEYKEIREIYIAHIKKTIES